MSEKRSTNFFFESFVRSQQQFQN